MSPRVAVMGTGFWARCAHVPALRELPDVVLDVAIGRTAEGARAFAASEGFRRWSTSLGDVLDSDEPPDLLMVAGPDDIHAAATTAALQAGVPVFCEKPLANTAAAGRELADLAERTRVPATVGFSFRYSPAIQALRADVASGHLGRTWLLELFEYNAQFHPRNGKPMNWKGDPAHAGAGALFEYGSHVVDLAGWLAGPVVAVSTCLTRVLPGARLDDVATLQLRLAPPAIGVLVSGWVLSGSIPGIRIRLHGSEGLGEVELSETVPGGQAYRRIALDGSIAEEVALESLENRTSAYAVRHLRDFIAGVQGNAIRYKATMPTLADGARVQLVLEAALAATSQWVEVSPA
jgi:predicted dehydrogenase